MFRRPCAHRAANLASEIRTANRLGEHEQAVTLYDTLCSIEPDDPSHRIGLARAQATAGDFVAALAALDEAAKVEDLTVTLRGSLLSRRAEVALAAGRLDEAAAAEREALELPMARGARRTHQLRLTAAEDPTLAPIVLSYLAPFESGAAAKTGAVRRLFAAMQVAELPGYRPLGSYLMARQLLNAQQPAPAVALLQRALAPEADDRPLPSPQFVRAAHIALMSACVQSGAFSVARDALRTLQALPDSGNGDALVAADWQERIEFFAAHRGG
ncbi:MAG: hypothetical protein AAF721_27690 [Myxococcota bacterium]